MGKGFVVRLLALMAVMCGCGALGAVGAAAAANPPGILIGPIKVKHGFTLTVSDTCTSKSTTLLSLDFSRGASKSNIDDSYSGGASVCKLSKKLGSGSLRAKWPGVATIKLSVRNPGKLTKAKVPRGCRGGGGSGRKATVTGTLSFSRHTGVFGKVNVHQAAATLDKAGNFDCSTGGSKDVTVFGEFGQVTVLGIQPPKGQRSVVASEPGVKLAGGVVESFSVFAQGAGKLFNATSGLASATFGAAKPYLTGSLAFTALPACSAAVPARNGTFSGTLVLHDPLSGDFKMVGPDATVAYSALGSASPGFCNGVGSTPTVAQFSNVCSSPGGCSVSAGTSTDTFSDESDAEPGAIVSESWNFGDGSAPVSGTLDGTVNHTYTKPGTYPVTLTLTDTQGKQYTASGTSYISS